VKLFIDESGVFVPAQSINSWSVCATLAAAEQAMPRIRNAIRNLRRRVGVGGEVKLDRVDEAQLLAFLADLNDPGVVVFASAIDSGLNTRDDLEWHQHGQVSRILKSAPQMTYPEGRAMVEDLADRIEKLSPQLYAQLLVHMDMIHRFLRRGTTYFAQWWPAALGSFEWRVDQKNKGQVETTYETVVRDLTPAILQTRSMNEPMVFVIGENYSHMEKYIFTPDSFPEHLRSAMPPGAKLDGVDVGKILTEDLRFADSSTIAGLQAADIVASSIRRALRGNFSRLPEVARALGKLMVQEAGGEAPIHLLNAGSDRAVRHATGTVANVVITMRASCKRMVRSR
jgi:hypothetical protein